MTKTVAGASPKERIAEGKRRRELVKRQAHAGWTARARAFDPIQVVKESNAGRLPRLLPIKYGRMRQSPFAFFRGSVSIMAADLAAAPSSGLDVQLCGDAHVQNLGSFAAPDGKLVFDLNDFDETIRGPWEWDVKRMAASLVLAGRESGHDDAACRTAAEACAASYCRFMDEFSRLPFLEVARRQVRREGRVEPIHAALMQSERASPLDLLKRLTERASNGRPRFRNQKPTLWRVQGRTARDVVGSLKAYRATLGAARPRFFDLFRVVDVGFKVVGTGSVGMRDYVVLFEGNGPRDPMFLQIKQEVASAYAKYLPNGAAGHEGRRVAQGQRAIQPLSDLLLGWTGIGPHQYLVRQLNDHKGSIDLQNLRGGGLKSLAVVAGELLARGHARSGDACRIRGYCGAGGKMAKALGDFAMEYAAQAEKDYRAFLAAIRSGAIKAARAAS
jgi:uncharacterized protein (DUF2252 family)